MDQQEKLPKTDSEPKKSQEKGEGAFFDEEFRVDPDNDLEAIKDILSRMSADGRIISKHGYADNLKYSSEQLERGEWEDKDFSLAIKEVKEERIQGFLHKLATEYATSYPVYDSIVRLDQEKAITEDLENDRPVLIRGYWRIGKTSMALSIANHSYGEINSINLDIRGETESSESLEKMRSHFGILDVAEFITERENPGQNSREMLEKKYEIAESIRENSKTAFEYLNDYLEERGEKALLSIDEVVSFKDEDVVDGLDKLKFIASLRDLKNLRLAVVLHRLSEDEDVFGEVFDGFATHFIRPLSKEEVNALVHKPLEKTGISFIPGAIRKIHSFTGGRPMEVNNLCDAIFDPNSPHHKRKSLYTEGDIEEITEKPISLRMEGLFYKPLRNYQKIYNQAISPEEKQILSRLAKDGEIPFEKLSEDEVKPLIDSTLIVEDDKKKVYKINGELFERYLEYLLGEP